MTLVLDASVALKWFFRSRDDEPDVPAALDILQGWANGAHQLIAPPHFIAEVCAVLERESPDRMEADLADLLALAIPVGGDALVLSRAMRMSHELDHHLFDTLYHALALETDDAVLVTADNRYRARAATEGSILGLSEWSERYDARP